MRSEERRSNIMTKARFQPFFRANIILGCFDGERLFPRSITEKHIALYLNRNHFCSIWKSENVSFNKLLKN